MEDSVANEVLSLQQEKVIIRELNELRKSLPYAEPLEKIQISIRETLVKKKEFSKKSQEIY